MMSNKDRILVLAITLAVMCPSLPVLGNPENVSGLLLLIVLVFWDGKRALTSTAYGLTLVCLLAAFSTWVGMMTIKEPPVLNISSIAAYIRLIICYQAFWHADDRNRVMLSSLYIGSVASVFGVLQFFSSDIGNFTKKYYLAAERSSVYVADTSQNSVVRVLSFFENPSSVGLVAILLALLFIQRSAGGRLSGSKTLFFVLLNMFAGLLSMSKVFFVGVPIVVLQLISQRKLKTVIFFSVSLLAALLAVYSTDSTFSEVIKYYIRASFDPDIALKGRYLTSQIEVIKNSLFFGYGVLSLNDVIINDSAYLGLVYCFGLIGLLVVATHLLWWMYPRLGGVSLTSCLMLIMIVLAGLGTGSIFGFRLDIYVTALLALSMAASDGKARA